MISGPLTLIEVRAALAGDGAGDQRLAGAGRAVEQDALGRLDAEPVEELGVLERQLDQLADVLQLASQAADVLVGDLAAARRGARAGRLDAQARARFERDGAGGVGGEDLELARGEPEARHAHEVAGDDDEAAQRARDVAQLRLAERGRAAHGNERDADRWLRLAPRAA